MNDDTLRPLGTDRTRTQAHPWVKIYIFSMVGYEMSGWMTNKVLKIILIFVNSHWNLIWKKKNSKSNVQIGHLIIFYY